MNNTVARSIGAVLLLCVGVTASPALTHTAARGEQINTTQGLPASPSAKAYKPVPSRTFAACSPVQ
jgi:hypothetical protein